MVSPPVFPTWTKRSVRLFVLKLRDFSLNGRDSSCEIDPKEVDIDAVLLLGSSDGNKVNDLRATNIKRAPRI